MLESGTKVLLRLFFFKHDSSLSVSSLTAFERSNVVIRPSAGDVSSILLSRKWWHPSSSPLFRQSQSSVWLLSQSQGIIGKTISSTMMGLTKIIVRVILSSKRERTKQHQKQGDEPVICPPLVEQESGQQEANTDMRRGREERRRGDTPPLHTSSRTDTTSSIVGGGGSSGSIPSSIATSQSFQEWYEETRSERDQNVAAGLEILLAMEDVARSHRKSVELSSRDELIERSSRKSYESNNTG